MGRYVPRKKELTVSTEVVGELLAVGAMVGVFAALAGIIKGVKYSIAKVRKSLTKDDTKTVKQLTHVERLAVRLEKTVNDLNTAKGINPTVDSDIGRLGATDVLSIARHLDGKVVAPLLKLLNATSKQLDKVHAINEQVDNSDDDVEFELDTESNTLVKIVNSFVKSNPINLGGLEIKADGAGIDYQYDRVTKEASVKIGSAEDLGKLLVGIGKVLELLVRYHTTKTSNYAQTETYWLYSIELML